MRLLGLSDLGFASLELRVVELGLLSQVVGFLLPDVPDLRIDLLQRLIVIVQIHLGGFIVFIIARRQLSRILRLPLSFRLMNRHPSSGLSDLLLLRRIGSMTAIFRLLVDSREGYVIRICILLADVGDPGLGSLFFGELI